MKVMDARTNPSKTTFLGQAENGCVEKLEQLIGQ